MLKKMFLTSGHLTLLTHPRSKLLEKGENSDYSEFMCNILKGLTLPETELEYLRDEAVELVYLIEGDIRASTQLCCSTLSNWVAFQKRGVPSESRMMIPDEQQTWIRHANQARLGWVDTMLERGYIEYEVEE
ncbi:hypothetical protein [Staphylococcus aureus]|uniref:hypothetical protein n=1 Tax=Staphylococcus aureus TaxID=1280 RepID=UPI003D21E12F